MRTRTAAAAATLLLATLTACSSSDPGPKPAVTATPSPTLDKAAITQQCTDAVAEVAKQATGEVPSEPTPAPCAGLDDSEYLDAYMDGISQANRDALEQRQLDRDKAAESDRP